MLSKNSCQNKVISILIFTLFTSFLFIMFFIKQAKSAPPLIKDEITINLTIGWNLVSFPFTPETESGELMKAEDLCNLINAQNGNCELIIPFTNGWNEIYDPFAPVFNFNIEAGCGYAIKCNSEASIILTGTLCKSKVFNFLKDRFYFFGPTGYGLYTAEELSNKLGTVREIIKNSQEIFDPDFPIFNFKLERGNAYFIRCAEDTSWWYVECNGQPLYNDVNNRGIYIWQAEDGLWHVHFDDSANISGTDAINNIPIDSNIITQAKTEEGYSFICNESSVNFKFNNVEPNNIYVGLWGFSPDSSSFNLPNIPIQENIISLVLSNPNPTIGETFTASINITNAIDVYGVVCDVNFDNTILEALSVECVTDGNTAIFQSPDVECMHRINNEKGEIVLAITRTGPRQGLSGAGILFNITFRIIKSGNTLLDFSKNSLHERLDDGSSNIIKSSWLGAPLQIICIPQIQITQPSYGTETCESSTDLCGIIQCIEDPSVTIQNITTGYSTVITPQLGPQGEFCVNGIPLSIGNNELAMTVQGDGIFMQKSVTVIRNDCRLKIQEPIPNKIFHSPSATVRGISYEEPVVVNGRLASIELSGDLYTFEVADIPLIEGKNSITATAAQNQDSVEVIYEPYGKEFQITFPVDGFVTNSNEIEIRGTVDNLDLTLEAIGPLEVIEAEILPNSLFKTKSPVSLEEGTNIIRVVAEDLAGMQYEREITIIRDSISPEILIETPKEDVFIHFNTASDFSQARVLDNIVITEDGSLILAKENQRIWEAYYEGQPITEFTCVAQDHSRGDIWLGTKQKGVYRIDKDYISHHYMIPALLDSRIYTIMVDELTGEVWLGTDQGAGLYNGEAWYKYSSTSISKWDDDHWIEYEDVDIGLAENHVRSIVIGGEDTDRVRWFATHGGLTEYRSHPDPNFVNWENPDISDWSTFDPNNSPLKSIILTAMKQDKNNNLWIGTDGAGVYRYDPISQEWEEFNQQNTSTPEWTSGIGNHIQVLLVDKENKVWLGTQTGLYYYNGEIWQGYTHDQESPETGLVENNIQGLSEDKTGNIWIATTSGISILLNDSQWNRFTTENSGLMSNDGRDIICAMDGSVWFCTGSGINHYYYPYQTMGTVQMRFQINEVMKYKNLLWEEKNISQATNVQARIRWASNKEGLDSASFTQFYDISPVDLAPFFTSQGLNDPDYVWLDIEATLTTQDNRVTPELFSIDVQYAQEVLISTHYAAISGKIKDMTRPIVWIDDYQADVVRIEDGIWEYYFQEIGLAPGRNIFYVHARDKGLNESQRALFISRESDSDLPEIQITSPLQGDKVTSPVFVQGIVNSCVTKVYVNDIIAAIENGVFHAEVLLEGMENHVTAIAYSNFGRMVSDSIDLRVFRITSPEHGMILNEKFLTIEGITDDSLDDIDMWVNEIKGPKAEVSENTFLASAIKLSEGLNEIRAIGKLTEDSISVILDSVPPEIFITDPKDNYEVIEIWVSDPVFEEIEIETLVVDMKNNLWIGTKKNGLYKYYAGEAVNFTNENSALTCNHITSIAVDRDNNKWIGTAGGWVYIFDPNDICQSCSKPEGFADENSPLGKYIKTIIVDSQGNKWFGTAGAGLVKLTINGTFNIYTKENALVNNFVFSLLEDHDGLIWAGLAQGQVSSFDPVTLTWKTQNIASHRLSSNHVLSISQDKSDNLWFGTYGGGLVQFDQQGIRTAHNVKDIRKRNQYTIGCMDSEYIMTIGDFVGSGFVDTNISESEDPYRLDGSIVNGPVSDPNEPIHDGLFQLASGFWEVIDHEPTEIGLEAQDSGLGDNVVNAIFPEIGGDLWIGTNAGLSRIKGENSEWVNYDPTSTDLPEGGINDIAIDIYGNKWFASNNGLYQLKKIYKTQNRHIDIRGWVNDIYDVKVLVDGYPAEMSGNTFAFANLALSPGVNTITVSAIDTANNKGLSHLEVYFPNPEDEGFENISPFYLTNLHLNYSGSEYTFNWELPEAYSPQGDILYQYSLDGNSGSTGWEMISENSIVMDQGLMEGLHTFKIQAKDGIYGCESSPILLPFSVGLPQVEIKNIKIDMDSNTAIISAQIIYQGFDTNGIGLPLYSYKLDDTDWSDWTDQTLIILPAILEGEHIFYVQGKDSAENLSNIVSETFFADFDPPVTGDIEKTEDQERNRIILTWTGTDNICTPGEITYSYKLNSHEWSAWESTTDAEYVGLSSGGHVFYLKAKDTANNITAESTIFKFEISEVLTQSPEVTITEGPAGFTKNNSVAFKWEANDNFTSTGDLVYSYRLVRLQPDYLTIDAEKGQVNIFWSNQEDASYKNRYDNEPWPNTWSYRKAIKFGDLDWSSILDGYAPIISYDPDDPIVHEPMTPGEHTFTVQTKYQSGIITFSSLNMLIESTIPYAEKINEEDLYPWTEWGTDLRAEFHGLNDGDYAFHVRAKDAGGNVSSFATNLFTIDTISPTLQAISPQVNDMTSLNPLIELSVENEPISRLFINGQEIDIPNWQVFPDNLVSSWMYRIDNLDLGTMLHEGFEIQVTDRAGNITNNQVGTSHILQIYLPEDGDILYYSPISVSGLIYLTERCKLYVAGPINTVEAHIDNEGFFKADGVKLVEGDNIINLSLQDLYRNLIEKQITVTGANLTKGVTLITQADPNTLIGQETSGIAPLKVRFVASIIGYEPPEEGSSESLRLRALLDEENDLIRAKAYTNEEIQIRARELVSQGVVIYEWDFDGDGEYEIVHISLEDTDIQTFVYQNVRFYHPRVRVWMAEEEPRYTDSIVINVNSQADSKSLMQPAEWQSIVDVCHFSLGMDTYIFILDKENNSIYKYKKGIELDTYIEKITLHGQWGSCQNPSGIEISQTGAFFVVDQGNDRVVQLTRGPFGLSLSLEITGLNQPYGIDLDNEEYIYISDTGNNQVHKYDPSGNLIYTIATFETEDDPQDAFLSPMGIISVGGYIYVVDNGNMRILKFASQDGSYRAMWSFEEEGALVDPVDIDYDDENRYLYVSDRAKQQIQVFNALGGYCYSINAELGIDLSAPEGLTIVNDINSKILYVSDPGSLKVARITGELLKRIDNEYYSQYSSANHKIVYVRNIGESSELYIVNADGTNLERVITVNSSGNMLGKRIEDPSWFPDGSKIVFVLHATDNDQICLINADGTNMNVLLEAEGKVDDPCFSRDGTRLAYAYREMVQGSDYEIYIGELDSDGDGLSDTWELKNGLNYLKDDLAEDLDGDGFHNYREFIEGTYPWDDANFPEMVSCTREDGFPCDQDGMDDQLETYYGLDPLRDDTTEDADGDGFINYREYIDGTDPLDESSFPANPPLINSINITQLSDKNDINPCWSPDGKRLAFASDRYDSDGKYRIFTLNIDNLTQIREIPREYGYSYLQPSWIKLIDEPIYGKGNGRLLYQRSSSTEPGALYSIGIDSDGFTQGDENELRTSASSCDHPGWSSDGQYIIFSEEGRLKKLFHDNPNQEPIILAGFSESEFTDNDPFYSLDRIPGLVAKPYEATAIDVRWISNPEMEYRVYYQKASDTGEPQEEYRDIPVGKTNLYRIKQLTPGSHYNLYISGIDKYGREVLTTEELNIGLPYVCAKFTYEADINDAYFYHFDASASQGESLEYTWIFHGEEQPSTDLPRKDWSFVKSSPKRVELIVRRKATDYWDSIVKIIYIEKDYKPEINYTVEKVLNGQGELVYLVHFDAQTLSQGADKLANWSLWDFGDGTPTWELNSLYIDHDYGLSEESRCYTVTVTLWRAGSVEDIEKLQLNPSLGDYSTTQKSICLDEDILEAVIDYKISNYSIEDGKCAIFFDASHSRGSNIDWENTEWLFVEPGTPSGTPKRGVTTVHTYTMTGEQRWYPVILTVKRKNSTDQDSVYKYIHVDADKLRAVIDYRIIDPNDRTVIFDASLSEGSNIDWGSCTWSFGKDRSLADARGISVTYDYPPSQDTEYYPVTLTIYRFNPGGRIETDTVTELIKIKENELQAVIDYEIVDDNTSNTKNLILFSAKHSEGENINWAACEWDFGDRTPKASGATVSHKYTTSAEHQRYPVTLTIYRHGNEQEFNSMTKYIDMEADELRAVINYEIDQYREEEQPDGTVVRKIESVVFDAKDSLGSGILWDRCEWYFDNDTCLNGATVSYAFHKEDMAYKHPVMLAIYRQNADGTMETDSIMQYILIEGDPLVASFTYRIQDDEGMGNGRTVIFDARDSKGSGIIWEKCKWNFGDELNSMDYGPIASHTFLLRGENHYYPVSLEICRLGVDETGHKVLKYTSTKKYIKIEGDELIADFTWQYLGDGYVQFNAYTSRGEAIDWSRCIWNFGDTADQRSKNWHHSHTVSSGSQSGSHVEASLFGLFGGGSTSGHYSGTSDTKADGGQIAASNSAIGPIGKHKYIDHMQGWWYPVTLTIYRLSPITHSYSESASKTIWINPSGIKITEPTHGSEIRDAFISIRGEIHEPEHKALVFVQNVDGQQFQAERDPAGNSFWYDKPFVLKEGWQTIKALARYPEHTQAQEISSYTISVKYTPPIPFAITQIKSSNWINNTFKKRLAIEGSIDHAWDVEVYVNGWKADINIDNPNLWKIELDVGDGRSLRFLNKRKVDYRIKAEAVNKTNNVTMGTIDKTYTLKYEKF